VCFVQVEDRITLREQRHHAAKFPIAGYLPFSVAAELGCGVAGAGGLAGPWASEPPSTALDVGCQRRGRTSPAGCDREKPEPGFQKMGVYSP
jgi:hypothetical protein